MQLHPQVPELRDNNPQRMVKIGSKSMSPRCINLEGYGWMLSTPEVTQNASNLMSNSKNLMQKYNPMIWQWMNRQWVNDDIYNEQWQYLQWNDGWHV